MVIWERTIVDPNVLVGKPAIKGTRISVQLILDRLSDGWSIDVSYPHVSRDDVLATLAFVC